MRATAPYVGDCAKPWTDGAGRNHSCIRRKGHDGPHRCGCDQTRSVA